MRYALHAASPSMHYLCKIWYMQYVMYYVPPVLCWMQCIIYFLVLHCTLHAITDSLDSLWSIHNNWFIGQSTIYTCVCCGRSVVCEALCISWHAPHKMHHTFFILYKTHTHKRTCYAAYLNSLSCVVHTTCHTVATIYNALNMVCYILLHIMYCVRATCVYKRISFHA